MQGTLPDQFIKGLSSACLQGRGQIIPDSQVNSENDCDSSLVFYLDGAHSSESMEMCARWFAHATNSDGIQPGPSEQPHTDRDSRKVCITVANFRVKSHFSLFCTCTYHFSSFTIYCLLDFLMFAVSPFQLHDCKRSSEIAPTSSRYMCSKWYINQILYVCLKILSHIMISFCSYSRVMMSGLWRKYKIPL
jgi:hypothetical protein